MEEDLLRRGGRGPVRVGRTWVRALIGYLFAVVSPVRFRLVVMDGRRARITPGTLVVMNHQTDWDGPVLASLIMRSGGRRGAGWRTSFLARGDLDRPGFIADYLLPKRRWSRLLFGRLSLKPLTDALGLRCVPGLGDPVAGKRAERVRRIRVALAGAADELAAGGCVLISPEGQFTVDGALAPIRGSVARIGPHARWVQPVTLTYDHSAGRRTGLFVRFMDSFAPADLDARALEQAVGARLRAGRIYALGQVVGLLLAGGLDPDLAVAGAGGDGLAEGVRSLAVTAHGAGLEVDSWLLRARPRETARRWRAWLRRAGPRGDRPLAGRAVPAWLDYWRHEAADGLAVLSQGDRERVLTAARGAAATVRSAAAAPAPPTDARRRPAWAAQWARANRLHGWLRPLGAGAVFAVTWLALRLMFRQAPMDDVVATLKGMSVGWLLIACAVNLFGYFARVPVWLAFLEGAPQPAGRREVFDLYVGGAFINNFIPLRGGDVARVAYLARQHGLGWARAAALVGAEHVFDLVVIAGYGAAGLLLTPDAPAWAGRVVLGFLGAAVAVAGVLVLSAERAAATGRPLQGLRAALIVPGTALLGASTQHRVALGTLTANLAGPLMMFALFRAAGLTAPAGPLLLATAVMTIGVGLPLTLANLGTYELIFGAVFTAFTGWPATEVVTVAMLSHLIGLVTVMGFGGLSLVHLGLEQPGPEHRATMV